MNIQQQKYRPTTKRHVCPFVTIEYPVRGRSMFVVTASLIRLVAQANSAVLKLKRKQNKTEQFKINTVHVTKLDLQYLPVLGVHSNVIHEVHRNTTLTMRKLFSGRALKVHSAEFCLTGNQCHYTGI